MYYNHYIIFSYDQEGIKSYNGNFRVDLLKSLFTITNVDINSFVWHVATTFTFTIMDKSPSKSHISTIIKKIKQDGLEPYLNYHIGELKHITTGKPVESSKSDLMSQNNFQIDVEKAKKLLMDGD